MEWPNLWAPWRIGYIKGVGEKPAGCFICNAWANPDNDDQNYVVARKASGLIMMNRYPYTNGHLMVVPGEHVGDLVDLPADRRATMMELIVQAEQLINLVLNPQGINLGINIGRSAGAGLPGHLHAHIVPRWGGDTNFMHVVGQVQVNPQALDDIFSEFRRAWPQIVSEAQA